MERKVVGIIGLGLLGGSVAKALKRFTEYEVIGYARRGEVCSAALACGAVSEAYGDAKLVAQKSDILVLALPPDTNADIFEQLAPHLKPHTLVTDVASTKGRMVKRIYQYLPNHSTFVSIHPMAGSERGGFEMASDSLFTDATWIVLEDKGNPAYSEDDAKLLVQMGEAVGSMVERVSLHEHDHLVATISHVPHVTATLIASLAGESNKPELAYKLAAGGFRDVTRIAGGNPSMWKEILRGNATEIDQLLLELTQRIQNVRELLTSDDDGQELEKYLQKAHDYRNEYLQVKESERRLL